MWNKLHKLLIPTESDCCTSTYYFHHSDLSFFSIPQATKTRKMKIYSNPRCSEWDMIQSNVFSTLMLIQYYVLFSFELNHSDDISNWSFLFDIFVFFLLNLKYNDTWSQRECRAQFFFSRNFVMYFLLFSNISISVHNTYKRFFLLCCLFQYACLLFSLFLFSFWITVAPLWFRNILYAPILVANT